MSEVTPSQVFEAIASLLRRMPDGTQRPHDHVVILCGREHPGVIDKTIMMSAKGQRPWFDTSIHPPQIFRFCSVLFRELMREDDSRQASLVMVYSRATDTFHYSFDLDEEAHPWFFSPLTVHDIVLAAIARAAEASARSDLSPNARQ